jgi:serine/threonine-protein kinase
VNGSSGSHPLVGAGLDTSEGRWFVRDRLALFGKVVALLGLGFWVVLFVMFSVLGPIPPLAYLSARATLAHLLGAAVMGHLWLVARRRESTLRTLGLIDALSLIVACLCWALMITTDFAGAPLVALLAGVLTVVPRAVVVPSTARRTLLLTVVALLPTLAVTVALTPEPRFPMAVLVALWIAATTAVATVTSSVIYGLRQRVKQATDLGAYTLEEKIGAGAMGEVWRARHRLLIRPAAIKLVRHHALGSSRADPDVLLRRFEREARATAALRSPHTVELYDFGVADDGTLYYVMELIEGFNLEQLVARFGPQPAERVVHILRQVCGSLAEAHRNGLIHRDIKPANIFVSPLTMAPDFVKVVDFGLVKLDRPADARLTAAGIAAGTPAYMAPECARGGASDHRADLYSLGCVAYWLLTGKLVFEGSSLAVLADHAATSPPRPSSRVELPVPRALDDLVLRCLAKAPAERPASAEALAAALDEVPLPVRWTDARAAHWWEVHARQIGEQRAVADLLLSQESRPRGRLTYEARA